MSHDEILKLVRAAAELAGPSLRTEFDAQLLKAVLAEREACAKECDDLARLNRTSDTDSMWQWEECAAAIRQRGRR